MKALSAYNAGSERVLSPRLLVVDAAREPIKALKILTEGLASHTRNGIWLVNFQGVPAARAASEFDLIYLDEEHRVLHGIEISQGRELEQFSGHPASALILPPKTITRSRTFTGDRLTIESTENRSIYAEPAAVSTSLIRSGSLARTSSSVVRPANQNTEIARNGPERKVIPIAGASAPLSDAVRSKTDKVPKPGLTPSVPVVARTAADHSLGAPRTIAPIPSGYTPPIPEPPPATPEIQFELKRTIAPTPRERAPGVTAAVIAEVPSTIEQPLVTHSFPPSKVASPQQSPIESQSKIATKTYTPGWARDVQGSALPSFRPDFEAGDELERLSKKIRSWLYPDAKSRRRVRRRAPRLNAPGLVGYYFAGGPSTPHEIRNISVMGFYMVTHQRFMPGTILRVTLQTLESDGEDPADSITVLSRVVRWGPDGGGFEFVFPGLKD